MMRGMTFSIVALSPDGSSLGVATATRTFCVGRYVPAIAPGVGAIATQAWTNRAFKHAAFRGLRRGATVEEVLEDLEAMDLAFQTRQVGLLSAGGDGAAHTGVDTDPWAGEIVEPGLVVVGNTLAGPDVLEAMRDRFRLGAERDDDFATLLVDCLLTGDAAGGDRRGRQSAAVMTAPHTVPDTEWPELEVDLRIDDHPDAIRELAVLLGRWRADELLSDD